MLKIIGGNASLPGEPVELRASGAQIYEDILSRGTVYCIKEFLLPAALDDLRSKVVSHFQGQDPWPIDYQGPQHSENYHAIESGVSRYQKTLHHFHAFVFNRLSRLEDRKLFQTFSSLASVREQLTGEQRSLLGLHDDGMQYRPQIFQYPQGGGMFAAHSHPIEPQKIGLILGLSKRGRDFQTGSTGFEAVDGSCVETETFHDLGDLLLFRYDLKHWVSPCDLELPLNGSSTLGGRWTAVLPIF